MTLQDALVIWSQLNDAPKGALTSTEQSALNEAFAVMEERYAALLSCHASGVGAIIGQWPGDETDEEIDDALDQLS